MNHHTVRLASAAAYQFNTKVDLQSTTLPNTQTKTTQSITAASELSPIRPPQLRSRFVVLIREVSVAHALWIRRCATNKPPKHPCSESACWPGPPATVTHDLHPDCAANLSSTQRGSLLLTDHPPSLFRDMEPWHTQTIPKNFTTQTCQCLRVGMLTAG
jgi:hypothetical protein